MLTNYKEIEKAYQDTWFGVYINGIQIFCWLVLSLLGQFITLCFTIFKNKYTPCKGNFNTFFFKCFLN